MIRIKFTDGSTKNYKIGYKRLGARNWNHLDYRPCFQLISNIINIDVERIEAWTVV